MKLEILFNSEKLLEVDDLSAYTLSSTISSSIKSFNVSTDNIDSVDENIVTIYNNLINYNNSSVDLVFTVDSHEIMSFTHIDNCTWNLINNSDPFNNKQQISITGS